MNFRWAPIFSVHLCRINVLGKRFDGGQGRAAVDACHLRFGFLGAGSYLAPWSEGSENIRLIEIIEANFVGNCCC